MNGRDVIVAAISHYDPSIDAELLADNIESGLDALGYEVVLPVLSFMAEPKTEEPSA